LTKEQRQKIKTVQETTNGNVQSIQEQIRALNPKADAAEIAALRKQIVEKRKESSLLLEAVLTEPQRDKLQRMRHGEIVQDRNEDRKDSQR
jgi:hypothetical protein